MQNSAFFKYAAGFLFLVNIALIAFIFFQSHRPKNPMKRNFVDKAIQLMDMDAEQSATFKKYAHAHNGKMDSIETAQRALLQPYFNKLFSENSPSESSSILNEAEKLAGRKISITYQHFQEIKLLLKQEQLAGFEKFMNQALEILLLKKVKDPIKSELQ